MIASLLRRTAPIALTVILALLSTVPRIDTGALVHAYVMDSTSIEPETVLVASGDLVSVAELDEALISAAKRANVKGMSFALINDGKIVHQRNYGVANIRTRTPVSDQTIFEFASMSKPAFGALVVDFASEGIIELDKPLAEYLPLADIDDPRAARITARQVLTHQTGLPNWRTDNPDKKLDIAFEPGTSKRYSGEGYEYLADVLMHILDIDDHGLDQVFRQRIAKPAGAIDTFFVQDSTRLARKAIGYFNGEPFSGDINYAEDGFGAAYSIHSTAEDYARLMIGLMDGPSLEAEVRQTFFEQQNVPIPADDPERAFGLTDHALGYAIFDLPTGRFYVHGGNNEGFSGISAMQPTKGWGFVIITNENQAVDFQISTLGFVVGLNSISEN